MILGGLLAAGDVICLSGDLGAGKTALTRGIGRGWGALERVTSPTFTLVHEHHRAQDGAVLYHVDCYRLEGGADPETIGLDEMIYNEGVLVMEWPENVQSALPDDRLWIALAIAGDNERTVAFEPSGARYEELAAHLRDRLAVADEDRSAHA